jgi:hypothetical protein
MGSIVTIELAPVIRMGTSRQTENHHQAIKKQSGAETRTMDEEKLIVS